MIQEHGLILNQSQLDDIIRVSKRFKDFVFVDECNEMDYSSFIEYLNDNNIKYQENEESDESIYAEVTPIDMEKRYFDEDGGYQVFI